MIYRKFGNTGIEISSLGFGCMRLPMTRGTDSKKIVDQDKVTAMLVRAHELGINYFDSGYMYNQFQSEHATGIALKGIRDKIYISTKCPGHLAKKPGDFRRIIEEQLTRLMTDYIDFYHFHGIGYDNFFETDKISGWQAEAMKAKEEGLFKHLSFSFHDKPENMIKLIDLGIFESVLCQYSAIDRSNEKVMAYAKQKGLGVAVMGPLGGGRVSGLPKEIADRLGIKTASNAELALRFVFSNPDVDCALSGMENMRMLEENAAVSEKRAPLSPMELEALNNLMKENERLSELYCTGCGYCQPCPEGVNIPHIFKMMNYYKIYGIRDYSRKGYAEIGKVPWTQGSNAAACTECGECEEKCPQKIPIREQLKESHKALG
ncbi:MAG: aldo/keto reductase [Spirochaetaceae bacterium]|nr:MAG: aldo/keto reductase [Spirochaetaceae bacterium]